MKECTTLLTDLTIEASSKQSDLGPQCLSKRLLKHFNRRQTQMTSCADPESFVKSRGAPNLIFYFVDRGIEDPNTAINGPSTARQRNTIEMAFRWRADDGPTLCAGLVAL